MYALLSAIYAQSFHWLEKNLKRKDKKKLKLNQHSKKHLIALTTAILGHFISAARSTNQIELDLHKACSLKTSK
jgi:hypothetical protein